MASRVIILGSLLLLALHLSLLVQPSRAHGGPNAMADPANPFSDSDCNIARGCFLGVGDTGVNSAWMLDPEEQVIRFSLWGPWSDDTGYMAVGISEDSGMESTDVYACILNGDDSLVKRYRTAASGKSVQSAPQKGFTNGSVAKVDGELQCQFARSVSLDDNDPDFYDVTSQLYFLLHASGTISGVEITRHSKRGPSAAAINLTLTFSAVAGAEEGLPLMKLHGCFMIIAWLGLASVGITLARYFKPMWPATKFCDVKVWFAIHRACMITALILFVTAFIVIFVHVGDIIRLESGADGQRRFAHTILGIIVTGLGILNPIMALFRPHPGTPNRPIFNWAHWGVGMLGFLLAIATIGLALGEVGGGTIIQGMEGYLLWVLVAFICFHALMWLLLELFRIMTDSTGRSDDIPLGGKGDAPAPADDEAPSGSVLKTILLFIYCLGVVFVVAFLVITIAII